MRIARPLALLAAVAALSAPVAALTLKIASIAPQATPWGQALDKMAADLLKATNGEVDMKIYHGGIAGDENDEIRKLKIGQIQGAVLTSVGMNVITPEPLTVSAPMLIRTEEELDLVLAKDRDYLKKKLEDKGLVILAFSKAGWIHFFSKKPLSSPDDLKKLKLATTPTDLSLAQAFKALGYNLTPIALSETLVGLSSGMVDAVYVSPLVAGAMQLFGVAKYMTDFQLSPGIGAIALSAQSWAKVSAGSKAKVLDYMAKLEAQLNRDISKLDQEAIKTMQGYGMIVTKTSPEELEVWRKDIISGIPATIGVSFDKDFYELVSKQLADFRAGKKD